MGHILLLGAGFSHNWDGWLADEVYDYLIGTPEVKNDNALRGLLSQHQMSGGGFEAALGSLQVSYTQNAAANQESLRKLQTAIQRMFDDMNEGFFRRQQIEFRSEEHTSELQSH